MKHTASILVVDDEEDIRQLLARVLSRAGYHTATAHDAHMALDTLQTAIFDLVITDLRMPGGMDGLDLLRAVAAHHPKTKAIVLTGYGSIQNAVEATKIGADNYVTKPIVIADFMRTVKATLDGGRPLRSPGLPPVELAALARLAQLLSQPPASPRHLAEGAADALAQLFAGHAMLRILDIHSGLALAEAEAGLSTTDSADAQAPESDTDALRLSAPLTTNNYFAGSIEIRRRPPASAFTENDALLLQVAADQVSIALSNHLANRSLERTLQELRSAGVQTVTALVKAVEMRDRYTAGHSVRVARYAVALARALHLDPAEVENIRVAALLHDVGKVGISDLILNKPGPLTTEERAVVEEHPLLGCQIIVGIPALAPCLPLIRHHQERFDGLGYPDRLSGEQIPLGARILAIADSFEAMTADRAYRRARSPSEAIRILQEGAGHHWDPELVATWCEIVQDVIADGS